MEPLIINDTSPILSHRAIPELGFLVSKTAINTPVIMKYSVCGGGILCDKVSAIICRHVSVKHVKSANIRLRRMCQHTWK